MVSVLGFPGPLYPPDDPQGRGSGASDFVLALKRTCGRIGAWPWTPGEWDDLYSNRFAHGDGWSDPTHAGIEGIQHWSGTITPSGNVGQQTFNFLRSVKIGQGLPHAGEMAMDSVCVSLINEAYNESLAPLVTSPSQRQRALDKSITQLGIKESPAGSNQCKYTNWYGMVGPWCAMFITWNYDQVGGNPSFSKFSNQYAYVPYIVSDAQFGINGLVTVTSPKPGDLVCYDWERNGEFDHIGFFERWTDDNTFTAIEGNTSTSNNSNGGQVMRRTRNMSDAAIIFVRVAE